MKQKIFKQDAKTIVDLFFDEKYFTKKVTRDIMNGFQDLIEHLLQSRYESYLRAKKLLDSIEKK